jgi:hypothetical protein
MSDRQAIRSFANRDGGTQAHCQDCLWNATLYNGDDKNLAAGRRHANDTGHSVSMSRVTEWVYSPPRRCK